MGIRDWPQEERPREKLLAEGAERLSNAELLAVVLGGGGPGVDAVAFARRLLGAHGGLRALLHAECGVLAAMPGLGAYAGSKFALEGMTEALRHELHPFGVRVVLVEPGPYKTDIFGRNRRVAKAVDEGDAGPYTAFARRMEQIVAKMEPKMGDPQEVADLVVGLLDEPSPRLRYPLGPGVKARIVARRALPWGGYERILHRMIGF